VPYILRDERLRERRWSAYLVFLGAMFLALVAALPILAATVSARGGQAAAVVPNFDVLDRNRDGYVDSSETAALAALAGTFARADRNRDGRLDRAEFETARRRLEGRP
jgi:Ca2+-binding EF-hand superfamily protein